jgi:3-polyprenyl-4-hydroxybenzoate decarboxylase
MTLRAYLQQLIDTGELLTLSMPVSKTYEIAGILKHSEPHPVMFEM